MTLALYEYIAEELSGGYPKPVLRQVVKTYEWTDLVNDIYLFLLQKGIDKPTQDQLPLIHEAIERLKSKNGRSYRSIGKLPPECNTGSQDDSLNPSEVLRDLFIEHLNIDAKINQLLN